MRRADRVANEGRMYDASGGKEGNAAACGGGAYDDGGGGGPDAGERASAGRNQHDGTLLSTPGEG